MLKRIRISVALIAAVLALTLGNARATDVSLSMTPPAGSLATPAVACPATASNLGVNGVYTITSRTCAQTLLSIGWGIVGNSHSWMAGSSSATVSNSAAAYIPFSGTGTSQASNEGDVSTTAATVGVLSNLHCVLTTAGGTVTVAGGTSYVMALRQNLTTVAPTCTILAAASSCSDNTDRVLTAVGDQLDYIDTPSGTPTALVVKCSMQVSN